MSRGISAAAKTFGGDLCTAPNVLAAISACPMGISRVRRKRIATMARTGSSAQISVVV